MEKITTAANNNKTEDTGERESKKKTQKQTSVTLKTMNKIFHMKLNL